jgi:hypothetical protein
MYDYVFEVVFSLPMFQVIFLYAFHYVLVVYVMCVDLSGHSLSRQSDRIHFGDWYTHRADSHTNTSEW